MTELLCCHHLAACHVPSALACQALTRPGTALAAGLDVPSVHAARLPAPIAAYSGPAGPGTIAVPSRKVCGQMVHPAEMGARPAPRP